MDTRHAAPTFSGPAILDRCPECGHARDDLSRSPGQRRRQDWTYVVAVIVASAAATWWLWSSSQSTRFTWATSSPVFLKTPFTKSDVEFIAQGKQIKPPENTGPTLVESLLDSVTMWADHLPGKRFVEINFMPGFGRLGRSQSFGWPVPLYTTRTNPRYANVAARKGLQICRTDPSRPAETRPSAMRGDSLTIPPRQQWVWNSWMLVYQPPPEETGGIESSTTYGLINWLVLAALVIACWWIAGLLALVSGQCSAWLATRRHRIRWALFGVLAIVILVKSFTTTNIVERADPGVSPVSIGNNNGGQWGYEGFARLALTLDEVEALREQADSDRVLANALLNPGPAIRSSLFRATRSATPIQERFEPDGLFLAVRCISESELDNFKCTMSLYKPGFLVCAIYEEYFVDESGQPMAAPQHTRWRWKPPYLALARPIPGVPSGCSRAQINVVYAGFMLAAFALFGSMARGVCRIVGLRVILRRHRRGRCVKCGYMLKMA